ncbi:MAG: hypothetical protein LBR84_07955 [Tannerella sp.]|nr:hypothetical protein [Tannerella sp.]
MSHDGSYKYKIHTGVYKTRPNITPSGEMFDYASPDCSSTTSCCGIDTR